MSKYLLNGIYIAKQIILNSDEMFSRHTSVMFSCSDKCITEIRGHYTPKDKTEQVTFGIKQSLIFQLVIFMKFKC